MKSAKEQGALTTADIFAVSPEHMPAVARILPYTDYFLPSIEEARALSGLSDMGDAARYFQDLGAKDLRVYARGERRVLPRQLRRNVSHARFDVAVKCTCGCGDAFNAGFAVGLVKGFNAEATVRFAQGTPGSMRRARLAGRRRVIRAHATFRGDREDPETVKRRPAVTLVFRRHPGGRGAGGRCGARSTSRSGSNESTRRRSPIRRSESRRSAVPPVASRRSALFARMRFRPAEAASMTGNRRAACCGV
jgi:hypothetical protein